MSLKDPRRQKELQRLLQKLGLADLSSVNWNLLDLALTHPSISQEYNYQQLEFIGDAVIRLASAELLWETYPHLSVGEFAAIRSILVSDRFLAKIAESYGFDRYLIMSGSVAKDHLGKMSRLADTFEAVLGALYESTKNMNLVRPWLDPILLEKAVEIYADPAKQNYKDALQEWSQGKYKLLPQYRMKENAEMQTENERFLAEVWLQNKLLGKGKGRTKKAAQQEAAKQAFFSINN
jgi:ribonuclease-3